MKIICSLFAPALVAILVRLALFILVLLLWLLTWIFGIPDDLIEDWLFFDIFSWGESWFYWILVIICSFLAEVIIWDED